jgi:hypothetical protein
MKQYPASRNLYRLIRLKLGEEISDREIARRWRMDIKTFIRIKQGRLPPPRIKRLKRLSMILKVPPLAVWKACTGIPANRLYRSRF